MPAVPKFQWPQGEPQFEVMWRSVTEALSGNGIDADGDFEVTATANSMEISVAAGTMHYLGNSYSLGSAQTFTLSAADGTYDRWDTVFFDTDHANGGTNATAGVHTGTADANPEPPDITGDEMLLAVVYVAAGATDVGDGDILNWRPTSESGSLTASNVSYDDSTGAYGVSDVDGALDELQEAAQAGAYPFALATDTDMDVAGTDLTDSTTVLYESTNGFVRNEVVQALGNFTSDETFAGYPLTIGTDVAAHLGGSDLLSASGGSKVFSQTDGHVPRPQVDDQRAIVTVTSSTYTTSDEEAVLMDTATIGQASTTTLASADATAGNAIAVLDSGGSAGTYPITVDTGGSESIDGSSSYTVDQNYSGAVFISDGTNWTTLSNALAGLTVDDNGASVVSAATGVDFGAGLNATDDGDRTVTVDADVAGKTVHASGTFTHTGGSSSTTTAQGVTTDQTKNLYVELGVDSDPAFNAAYAFDYEWDYSWDETNSEMDVVITATWSTDPGSGNDVTLDYEIFSIDDQATQGVATEDDGTEVVSPARAINFGTGLGVTDDGDQTVTVDGHQPTTIPIAKLTSSSGSTDINQSILLPWDSAALIDTGTFSYTSGDDYVTVDEAGTYEVHVNIAQSPTGSSRTNPNAFLYKNRTSSGSGGTGLDAAGKSGYARRNEGHRESSLNISWIGDLAAGDTLSIQMGQEASSGTVTLEATNTNMFVKQIPRP